MDTIRSRRRNRWRSKAELQRRDREVLKRIHRNYLWSMDTWGGTRCADCGVAVRPHWLCNYTASGPGFHIDGHGIDCSKVGNCKGPCDWMGKAADRVEKKLAKKFGGA